MAKGHQCYTNEMEKFKNLIGKTFSKLSVSHKDENLRKKRAYWICKCDCGNEVSVRGSHLITGQTKSCGCISLLDLNGKKFGKLTVISYSGKLTSRGRSKIWICKCDCGKEKTISSKCLISGETKSCGCIPFSNELNIEIRKITCIISKLKSASKHRKKIYSLSNDFVKKISFSKCFFCNGKPDTKGLIYKKNQKIEFLHIGIDRLDSKIGYTEENCVPCCKKCNWMKKDMNVNEWFFHMKKILENKK